MPSIPAQAGPLAGSLILHPSTHLLLHCGEILWPQRGRLRELDLPVGVLGEHAIDHAAVKVDSPE